ncbi:MAG: hypothetical protein JF615_03775 [Asticcacaulis sp.]|nr:hypothetical protein [Asticcacaulis sp.]
MDAFQTAWLNFHPNTWPLAHVLKDSPGWNLTRFHLLPDSRAVARDHTELRALLGRFNEMGNAVLGEHQICWLVTLRSPNEDRRNAARRRRLAAQYDMKPGWQFYSDSDNLSYTAHAAEVTWASGRFNRLFLHIYQRRLWDVIFMNRATGAVFAPYESGCDVSQPTPQGLIDVISAYYGWLPQSGHGFLHMNPAQMQGTTFKVSKPCSEAISRAIAQD